VSYLPCLCLSSETHRHMTKILEHSRAEAHTNAYTLACYLLIVTVLSNRTRSATLYFRPILGSSLAIWKQSYLLDRSMPT